MFIYHDQELTGSGGWIRTQRFSAYEADEIDQTSPHRNKAYLSFTAPTSDKVSRFASTNFFFCINAAPLGIVRRLAA